MASPHEKKEFESWYRALLAGKLTPSQLMVLQTMVDEGQAKNLERAAQLLDWQESVIDPDEHMYGY
jgi:predicted alpha-1,6-mannanase (GH76 family)